MTKKIPKKLQIIAQKNFLEFFAIIKQRWVTTLSHFTQMFCRRITTVPGVDDKQSIFRMSLCGNTDYLFKPLMKKYLFMFGPR